MQSIKNINELRNMSLRLIDDILNEKIKTSGDDKENQMLNQINKQINNAINITKVEMQYCKEKGKKIKFLEYENE
jgi:predicted component of type VI protein secretion system